MSETETKVSVILYADENVSYAQRCIESFRRQTMQDYELIVCMETAWSLEVRSFFEELSNECFQVHLLKRNCEPLVETWKAALEAAKGKYVLFFNMKDFVDENMLKNTVIRAEQKESDAILIAYENFHEETGRFLKEPECYVNESADENAEPCKLRFPRIKIGNLLFNREFLQQQNVSLQSFGVHQGLYYLYANFIRAEQIDVNQRGLVFFRKCESHFKQDTNDWLELLEVYETLSRELCMSKKHKMQELFESLFLYDIEELLNMSTDRKVLLEVAKVLKDKMNNINDSRIKGIFAFLRTYQKRHENYDEREMQVLCEQNATAYPEISVIMPVYNVEKELCVALESILTQTFRNIEIICINDGSTDGTLDVLQKYAKNDKRISVYTQPNCGQSVARNRGVERAKGKYIYFMDGDDFLDEFALEILYKQSEKYDLDVLYFDAAAFSETECEQLEEYNKYYERVHSYSQKVYTGLELMRQMCSYKEYMVSPCLQLIRKKHWDENRLKFHIGIIHEDNEFNFLCAIQAKRAAYCSIPLFKRRIREASTMTQKKTFEHVYGYYVSYTQVLRWLENNKVDSMYDAAICQILDNMRHGIKVAYATIDESERFAIKALDVQEQILLTHLIAE